MPPVIPARLKIGVEVPWVTSWSQETQTGIGPCPTVDNKLAAIQLWKPGAGEPLYARNHMRRQRDSVRALLCPMCGEATHDGDRWSQTAKFAAAGLLRARGFGPALPVDMDDEQVLLDCGAIAPLHMRCATASLQRCPHLAAMPDKELKGFPPAWIVVPHYIEVRQTVGPSRVAVSVLQLLGVTQDRDPDWRSRLPQG